MAFLGNIITTTFTTSGMWTKAPTTQYIQVIMFEGGSGGGSGRQGASTTAGGGSGGGGSAVVINSAPAEFFGATETVTIGAAGLGGAAITVNDTDGNPGNDGGTCQFGNFTTISTNLTEGAGGSSTAVIAGQGGDIYVDWILGPGSSGTNGNVEDGITYPPETISTQVGGTGGGGAGGADDTLERSGANGRDFTSNGTIVVLAGGLGGIESGAIDGGNGNDQLLTSASMNGGTGGGGGGGQSVGPVAGNGGNGGYPGGAGGGGGGSLNGTDSGAGGDGADGVIIIIEFS